MKALIELRRTPAGLVTMLMTCDEESSSPFSRRIVEEEALKSRAGLVVEPPIPGGNLKTSRKGVAEFELGVHGRAAHAGNDPLAGISAITELAYQILAVAALNDNQRGTTVNVGVAHGGGLPNVVPAEARAQIDVRFVTAEDAERVTRAMMNLKPVLRGATLEVRGRINRPPLERTAAVARMFDHAARLASELGFEIGEGSVGGGSDGNFIGAIGVPVLDGLGVDGKGAHAENEHIIISDIPRRAALLARLIETL
jgi:glutamate carboxypeptidase